MSEDIELMKRRFTRVQGQLEQGLTLSHEQVFETLRARFKSIDVCQCGSEFKGSDTVEIS